ncbi:MAG: Holliday junction branch migration protein RuvA [Ruminococcaceae bacterium]|nr:Holliday junction branch migration protein RuvA [Oscillospiraceae bacterium]
MIYSVNGTLVHMEQGLAVVECAGVGYACQTTSETLSQIALGEQVRLFTHLYVREDNVELFGFVSREELSAFRLLLSVSGVGPKVALGVLSEMNPQRLALNIAAGDHKALQRAPGVGAKVAQRIILELKDKLGKGAVDFTVPASVERVAEAAANSAASEAINALCVLGYSRADAAAAVATLPPDTSVEDMIRMSLKKLASFK